VNCKVERPSEFRPWDFGKGMEGDVVEANSQTIEEILRQSAVIRHNDWQNVVAMVGSYT